MIDSRFVLFLPPPQTPFRRVRRKKNPITKPLLLKKQKSSCHSKYCPNLTFDSYDLTHYCPGTATPVSSPAQTTPATSASTTATHPSTGKSSSSSSSSSAGAAASASSAQATSTTSSTAAKSSPNAGQHSVVVSVRGVFLAFAALAVACGFA